MVNLSMTDDNEIESLKAEIKSLFDIVKTNAETEVSAARDSLLIEIESLSAKLNKDFKIEEYKDVSLDSLQYRAGVLREVIETLVDKSETGDLAGLVTRGTIDSLSAEQIEDIVLDLIQLAFGLEPADDEIKAQMRLEREADGFTLRRQ